MPAAMVEAFEAALAETALAVSQFEIDNSSNWRVDALFENTPDRLPFNALLDRLTQDQQTLPPQIVVSRSQDEDWVGKSLGGLETVQAGRYFVCGRHDAALTPANATQILIEAEQAFGKGHHETTRGCLLALERINRLGKPRGPLNLGCGTGILAITMAKTWQVRTIASDIDPAAARVILENAKINGVGKLVCAVTSDGLNHALLRKNGPYDVIAENILARPFRALAQAIALNTTSGRYVVLSGLLSSQERSVVAAFHSQGLARWHRIRLNG